MGWPGPMTHRQWQAWQRWQAEDWNRPDRSDHYQARVALEIRQFLGAFSKSPPRLQLSDFLLQFGVSQEEGEAGEEMTVEEATRQAKARWGLALGREAPAAPPAPPQIGPPRTMPREEALARARRAWPELYGPVAEEPSSG